MVDELRKLETLEDVMHWMKASGLPLRSMQMIAQDEYSHDVLVPLSDGRWAVFAST